jgi:hypothetical protein
LALGILAAGLASCTALESPRQRATHAVERLGAAGLSLRIADEEVLHIPAGGIEVLAMDAYPTERGSLEAFAQLSVDGSVEGAMGPVAVSYLGNERLALRCGARRCEVEGELAGRLQGVVEALARRQLALRSQDLVALTSLAASPGPIDEDALRRGGERAVASWFIRVETDSAIVGEAGPDGAQRRLHLREGPGGWRFVGGLL